MVSRSARNATLDLFTDGRDALHTRPDLSWPEQERVPLNVGRERRVRKAVDVDLRASSTPLVVTGFAGLDELIDTAATYPIEKGTLRFLLGQEPFASRRDEYRLARNAFPKEVQQYWLARGFSLLLSVKLVTFMDRLKAGRIQAHYLADGGERLHAKIYCGDEAVTVGSSNFTRPGLDRLLEANVRFTRARESKRYGELRDVAENYWVMGHDYKDALLELLNQLLKVAGWREALARACAELLEGDWARAYLDHDSPGGSLTPKRS